MADDDDNGAQNVAGAAAPQTSVRQSQTFVQDNSTTRANFQQQQQQQHNNAQGLAESHVPSSHQQIRASSSGSRQHHHHQKQKSQTPLGVVPLPPGSRGPRSLYLRRQENGGFGFTLRHFIVYPPDTCVSGSNEVYDPAALLQPMDTIFVKRVAEDGAGARAGLKQGDRIVAVNGRTVTDLTYAQVVALIKRGPAYLHLLVVPQEDDVLQKYFSETAHNPETNQRPLIGVEAPSHETIDRQLHRLNARLAPRPDRVNMLPQSNSPAPATTANSTPRQRLSSAQSHAPWSPIGSYGGPREASTFSGIDNREMFYGRHLKDSVYYGNEPIYHVPKDVNRRSTNPSKYPIDADGIYSSPRDCLEYRPIQSSSERVRLIADDNTSDIYSEPYVQDLYRRPRPEPQVPAGKSGARPQVPTNLRSSMRRTLVRRASEGSNVSDNSKETGYSYESGDYCSINSANSDDMVVNSNKINSASKVVSGSGNDMYSARNLPLSADPRSRNICDVDPQGRFSYPNNPNCRLSLDDGRRESSASLMSCATEGSKDSLSSFDSTSTLTSHETDDSVIISKIRKSFEKKEEFLRRPSQPIGWVHAPDDFKNIPTTVIQREFYGCPKKLQKQLWPPPELEGISHERRESPSRSLRGASKPTHQNFQRVKTDLDSERVYLPVDISDEKLHDNIQYLCSEDYGLRHDGNDMMTQKSGSDPNLRSSRDKNTFRRTLCRINENIPATVAQFGSNDDGSGSGSNKSNGSSSLPNSPGPYSHMPDENSRYPPVVMRRTRQFETGRPLPDDEACSPSDRTSLHSSELARLSSKRVVPNVAARKREFESRSEESRRERENSRRIVSRESRSLESADIPLNTDNPPVQLRARSNSAESWTAAMQSNSADQGGRAGGRMRAPPDWHASPDDLEEDKQRHKAVRQDSYLAAVREPSANKVTDHFSRNTISRPVLEEQEETSPSQKDRSPAKTQTVPNANTPNVNVDYNNITPIVTITPASTIKIPAIRPTHLAINQPLRPASTGQHLLTPEEQVGTPPVGDMNDLSPVSSGDANISAVVRRNKNNTNYLGDEERSMRRVSYLKATHDNCMLVDNDHELSDNEATQAQVLRSNSVSGGSSGGSSGAENRTVAPSGKENHRPIIQEGFLNCKVTLQDRKRAADRSWKQVWAVLKGPILYLNKDRHHHQSPMGESDASAAAPVDMRYNEVNVADDYTKRKHVFRVSSTSGAELLLQAESYNDMRRWVDALQDHSSPPEPEIDQDGASSKQQAVPQQVPAATSIQVQGTTRLSPIPGHKSIRKFTSFRNRSPTGQSPVNKTRKPSENLPSPKSKTWGRVVKQFRKIHQGGGSPNSPTVPEGATIGIPLDACPQSTFSEYVPLLVETCTKIVEERGLDVIGIYRVPGNTAAITLLTEDVNKGFTVANLQDPRWNDVNVVSSLLKSFFRRLPDSLLTVDLYPKFIEADKIDDNNVRLSAIRKLVRELPDHNYETLKYLLFHLKKVVEHSEINKMEARNLAIVFGPTLVRAADDNMVTMVTDMSHQCRIVESLLCHVDWFFYEEDDGDFTLPPAVSLDSAPVEMESATSMANHDLLLGNINKIEGLKSTSGTRKEIAKVKSSIISAANRKMQRGNGKARSKNGRTKDTASGVDAKDSTSYDEIPVKQNTENGKYNMKSEDIDRRPEIPATIPTEIELYEDSRCAPSAALCSNDISDDQSSLSYAILSPKTKERLRKREMEKNERIRKFVMDTKKNLSPESRRSIDEEDNRRIELEWRKPGSDEYAHGAAVGNTSDIMKRYSTNSNVSDSSSLLRDSNSIRPSPVSSTDRLLARSQFLDPSFRDFDPKVSTNLNDNQRTLMKNFSASNVFNSTRDGETSRSNGSTLFREFNVKPFDGDRCNIPKDPRSRSSIAGTERSHPSVLNTEMRKGGSIESVNMQNSEQPRSIFTITKVTPNGTLKRLKTGRDQMALMGIDNLSSQQRCGSLDSLHAIGETYRASTDFSDDGSDLLTSLTTTFDRKLRSLHDPVTPSPLLDESIPYVDESPEKNPTSSFDTKKSKPDRITSLNIQPIGSSVKLFRNPSLHKSTNEETFDAPIPKTNKNVEKEKDEDCSKEENFPDNDRIVRENKSDKTEPTEPTDGSIKLKRSESLNKTDRAASPSTSKVKRSESLNKSSDKSEKLKRSDSLTKTEKTESNISKKREISENRRAFREISTKLKRKNGMPERSIKRRHTVGGTKDFDKSLWLDNRLQNKAECDESECINCDETKEKSSLRTSSPDLSSSRRERIFEVSLLCTEESMVVALRQHYVGARPQSLPEAQVYKVPLESHV